MEMIEKTAAPRKNGRNPKFNKAVLKISIYFFPTVARVIHDSMKSAESS
jgi:hypothetical protein